MFAGECADDFVLKDNCAWFKQDLAVCSFEKMKTSYLCGSFNVGMDGNGMMLVMSFWNILFKRKLSMT